MDVKTEKMDFIDAVVKEEYEIEEMPEEAESREWETWDANALPAEAIKAEPEEPEDVKNVMLLDTKPQGLDCVSDLEQNGTHQCGICGRSFKNRYTLKSHMVKHQKKKGFPCPYCTRVILQKKRLMHHLKTNHECSVCGAMFRMNIERTTHMQQVHYASSSRISWSHEMVNGLIKAVRGEPAIWDYKCKAYKERSCRYDGFRTICEKLSHLSPELTTDLCRIKWHNLKSYYQVIVNNEQKQSGSPYKKTPAWIYYKAMSFLKPTLAIINTEENFHLTSENGKKLQARCISTDTQSVEQPEEQIKDHPEEQPEEQPKKQSEEQTEEHPEEQPVKQPDGIINEQSGSQTDSRSIPESSKQQANINYVPHINHIAKKKFIEEKRARPDCNKQMTLCEKRAMIWAQELNEIQDVQLRGQCIIKITGIIQEALMKDQEKRQNIS